jgi:hypothetical protein
MDWLAGLVRRFRDDLRGLVVTWVIAIAIVIVIGILNNAAFDRPVGLLAGMVVLGVALTPIIWLRWEMPILAGRHRGRRSCMAVLLAVLWAVAVLAVGAVAIDAIGLR